MKKSRRPSVSSEGLSDVRARATPSLATPATVSTAVAKRADAERNRATVLAAARAAFADTNGDVSMAEVARRANVGMATLYRNFANKRELLEALFTGDVDAVCDAAATDTRKSPDAAFVAWLETFFAFVLTKRSIAAELLAHAELTDPVFAESRARVVTAARPLLTRAQRAKTIRRDVTVEHVLDLMVAIAGIDGDPRYLEPIVAAAIEGLRT